MSLRIINTTRMRQRNDNLSISCLFSVHVLRFFLLQLRFQKCVDAHPEIMQKVAVTEQEKLKEKVEKDKCEKDKVS